MCSDQMYDDEATVAGCLRGENSAWEAMFRHYHPRLVSIIKAEMNWQCSTDQAEEIAASIWCSLCSETVLSPPAVRSSGWSITHLPQGPGPGRNLEEKDARRKIADLGNAVPLAARRPRTRPNRAIVVQEFLDILTRQERSVLPVLSHETISDIPVNQ